MEKAIFTYPCGHVQEIELKPNQIKLYGLRYDNSRPTTAEVHVHELNDCTKELIYRSIKYAMHPVYHTILVIVGEKLRRTEMPEENLKPFGELSREEQVALFEAWLDGYAIEFKSVLIGDTFAVLHQPKWDMNGYYRIALTKPSINWDHVHPDYVWLAMDKNEKGYLYIDEPEDGDNSWVTSTDEYAAASSHISYKQGTCDWRNSKVRRPK